MQPPYKYHEMTESGQSRASKLRYEIEGLTSVLQVTNRQSAIRYPIWPFYTCIGALAISNAAA